MQGPHGVAGSPWHHRGPVASWGPCGVPVASDALGPVALWLKLMCKGTSPSPPVHRLVAATASQWQGQGWGQGWGQSRSARASWAEAATSQGLGWSRCSVSRWRGQAGAALAPGRRRGPLGTHPCERHCQGRGGLCFSPRGWSVPEQGTRRLSPSVPFSPCSALAPAQAQLPPERRQPSPVPQDTREMPTPPCPTSPMR